MTRVAVSAGSSALVIDFTDPAPAGQVASGRGYGGGAVPGRLHATVPAAPEAARGTGTVEPAAGPAESRPMAAGRPFPQPEDHP